MKCVSVQDTAVAPSASDHLVKEPCSEKSACPHINNITILVFFNQNGERRPLLLRKRLMAADVRRTHYNIPYEYLGMQRLHMYRYISM